MTPERPQGSAIWEDPKGGAGGTVGGPQRMVRPGYGKSERGHPGPRD